LVSIPENKGLKHEDGYSKYDPEESVDQQLINSGAHQEGIEE
jgi:hypothetical protein